MKRNVFVMIGVVSIVVISGLGALTSYATGTTGIITSQETKVNAVTYNSDMVKNMGQWEVANGAWKFKLKEGAYLTNAWIESMKIPGAYYYVDFSGIMLTNATTPDGYAVGSDGLWIGTSTEIQKEIESQIKETPVETMPSQEFKDLNDYYKSVSESIANDPEYNKVVDENTAKLVDGN